MDIPQLKKTAIEALSVSGSLLQQGHPAQAKEEAIKALAAYEELQHRKNADDDYSDLIEAARHQLRLCTSPDEALRLGLKFLMPRHGCVDMHRSAECYRWGADVLLNEENPDPSLLSEALCGAVEAASYAGDLAAAAAYAKLGMDHGTGIGIYFHIAYQGLRHGSESAMALIDEMVKAGAWQGLLLKGIMALRACIDRGYGEDNSELDAIVQEMLAIYDADPDSPGGRACMAFIVYNLFLSNGPSLFDDEAMDLLRAGVGQEDPWCLNYYGQVCDIMADLSDDHERAEQLRAEAAKHLRQGATLGNREALKHYCALLLNSGADGEILDFWKPIALAYEIDL